MLTNQLSSIFQDVTNRFIYLSLSGCRLSYNDVEFLSQFCGLPALQELNLDHNNLRQSVDHVFRIFERCSQLRVLNLESSLFTSFDADGIIRPLRSLEYFEITERPTPQIVFDPASIIRPLMTLGPKLLKIVFHLHGIHSYEYSEYAASRPNTDLLKVI